MACCANPDQLERLVQDRLGDVERETIAVHVRDCKACQDILDRLTVSPGATDSTEEEEPWTEREARLVQNLKSHGPPLFDPAYFRALGPEQDEPRHPAARLAIHEPDAVHAAPFDDPHLSIPGFSILREVGRGGMGVVYEAEELTLGRRVALKVLPAGALNHRRQVERFRREAKAAASLHHTNIVPVFGVGEHAGQPYYVMEYIDGQGLDVVLKELRLQRQDGSSPRPGAALGPLDAPAPAQSSGRDRLHFMRVARIGLEVAEAMDHADRQGVLHRDIKPSNLLLDTAGSVRITDFGLAKIADSEELTDTGDIVGTLHYMAPERFQGRCDVKSDIYSLGLTLYDLVALRRAFEASDRQQLIEKVLHQEPERLNRLAPKVPRDLETIIHKAIARVPEQRYATAALLAEDLRRFLDGRPILARPVRLWERSWRWCRRNPRLAAVSGALASTVLFASGAFLGLTYRHNLELRSEIGRTQTKAAEVRRNYQQAGSTIEAMLHLLDEPRFDGVPRLVDLRHDQRQVALAFYEGIRGSSDSGDSVVNMDTVRALGAVATLQLQLGQVKPAVEGLEKALGLIESLRPKQTDPIEFLSLEVDILGKFGACCSELGQRKKAENTLRKAVELGKKLVDALPDDLPKREQLAMAYNMYANLMFVAHRYDDAMTYFHECTKIREHIDPAKLPGVTLRLGDSLSNEGLILWSQGNNTDAQARFRRAEKTLLSVPPEQHSLGGNVDLSLGTLKIVWSGSLMSTARLYEAIDQVDSALPGVEDYLGKEPNDHIARGICLKLRGNRALVFTRLQRHTEAAKDWARVVELSPEPVPDDYRVRLAIELLQTNEQLHADELTSGLAQAKFLKPTAEKIASMDRYKLGCLYGRCAKSVQTDANVSPAQRSHLVKAHIKGALDWLKSAREAGFFKEQSTRDRARNDPDLAMLAELDEFRQIIEPPRTDR
jgi:serine/threonine protein kinase